MSNETDGSERETVPCYRCGDPLPLPGMILDKPPYCSDCADEVFQ